MREVDQVVEWHLGEAIETEGVDLAGRVGQLGLAEVGERGSGDDAPCGFEVPWGPAPQPGIPFDQEVRSVQHLPAGSGELIGECDGKLAIGADADVVAEQTERAEDLATSAASGNVRAVDELAESAVVGVAVPPDDVAADH